MAASAAARASASRRTFELYDYAAPWLRRAARDAAELPALRDVVEDMARERTTLVSAALAPGFPAGPPRRLVAVASALLDFPSWQSVTAAGFTSAGAAAVVGDALEAIASASRKETT